jgi:hypothetical protein
MANVSLYVSGQTERNDVTEFFQKGLMSAGENPIAFFEGVFYESHQERVGNIAFQDYLIYSDKAVYLWARGADKDYLDRFNLGSLSVNSRNKDHDFSTLNLKVRREDKEPVYVIFDMVELREAELITRLHTVIETIIEENLGLNYRKNLPDEVSARILEGSRSVCEPQSFSLRFENPDPAQQESHIGYGQDLLEQYKASLGYPPDERQRQQGGEQRPEGFSAADALKGIENLLPANPASLKRVAESIKGIIGDAPFKIRDQVKSDLQHIPGMLTALSELLNSIADNPQTERLVINIVKTAVRNDGVIGSVGKLLRLSSNFGDSSKRRGERPSSKSDNRESRHDSSQARDRDSSEDNDTAYLRKKIQIHSDDDATLNDDCFSSSDSCTEKNRGSATSGASGSKKRTPNEPGDDAVPARKKISITSVDEGMPSLVKNMMIMDDFSLDSASPVDQVQGADAVVSARKNADAPKAENVKQSDNGDDSQGANYR